MAGTEEYAVLDNPDLLIARVDKLRKAGYRLGQACVVTKAGAFDVVYSFARDLDLVNLRLAVPEDGEVESITSIYPYAFLYENEMRDLFGLRVNNIVVDFEGSLYQLKVKTPFAPSPAPAPDPDAKDG